MINDTIFEIPVYPCTQDEANKRIAKQVERDMKDVPDYGTGFWEEQRDAEIKRNGVVIRFNELIGAIEIHTVGSQLRADYWLSEKKRIVVGAKTKAKIMWRGKLLEKHFQPHKDLTSEEIRSEFRTSLLRTIRQTNSLKKRFVDFSVFDRVAPYINWARLIKESAASSNVANDT